jgi:tRNA1(Val) A37 N6-methylase TrmN6
MMKAEWFKDKKVLDIGCNSGIVDLIIASRFMPKLVIGIDIDHRLIANAIKNMQHVINDQEQMELLFQEMIKQHEQRENVEMKDEYD